MRTCVLPRVFQARKLLSEYFSSHKCKTITYSHLRQTKQFFTSSQEKCNDKSLKENDEHNLSAPIDFKYKVFHDKDAEIIFDVNEEQQRTTKEELDIDNEYQDPYAGLNLNRGTSGVFDIEDLVTVLKTDNAKDIFVVKVPLEYSYVDYIVVVTGKSKKHIQALGTFVRKVYKLKRHKHDTIPKLEGENSKDWVALDLGNIALHIFTKSARIHYNLETLWSIGQEFDDESNKPTPMNIMDQYNEFLANFEPADTEKNEHENTNTN